MGGTSGQQDQPDPEAFRCTMSAYYMPSLGWAQGIQGEEHKLCAIMEQGAGEENNVEVERWCFLYLEWSRMVSLVKCDF